MMVFDNVKIVLRYWVSLALFMLVVLVSPWGEKAHSQTLTQAQTQVTDATDGVGRAGPVIPNFFDPNMRFNKPDLGRIGRIKFLTTTDFPPFNFIDRKGRLSGFHVDLARAICSELDILPRCQIQALPFDQLTPQLLTGNAEALIAGHAISKESRNDIVFSNVYLRIPARFVARRDSNLTLPLFQGLFKKMVGVVEGSSHEAYFKNVFHERKYKTYPSREALFDALKKKEVDAAFSDSVSIGFWLTSKNSEDCCQFVGGPYLSEKYFGSGLAIALPKNNPKLEIAINSALKAINDSGEFSELYLRYFPLGLF